MNDQKKLIVLLLAVLDFIFLREIFPLQICFENKSQVNFNQTILF